MIQTPQPFQPVTPPALQLDQPVPQPLVFREASRNRLPELTRPARGRDPARSTFEPLRASELMALELPPIRFAVPKFFPEGLVILAGKPKLGKSWLALHVAIAISRGESVFGESVEQGDVLYLALEDHPRRLQERLRLIDAAADWEESRVDFAFHCPRLDAGGMEAIKEWLQQADNPRMIVADVWGRLAPEKASGKDDYAHITEVMQQLQKLAFEHHVCILLVAHARKGVAESGDVFDQVLGSIGFTSNADATAVLTRSRMQGDATLSITGRDIDEREQGLKFDRSTHRWVLASAPGLPSATTAMQDVFDAIEAGHTTPTALKQHLGKTYGAVMDLLKRLKEDGLVEQVDRGQYRVATQEFSDLTDFADILI